MGLLAGSLVALGLTAFTAVCPQIAHADTVSLYPSGSSVWVQTQSGKTTCQVDSEFVACAAAFEVPTPLAYGQPSNVVTVRPSGALSWTLGDTGPVSPTTLIYGTTYSANGWTINPTNMGTTFTNDATGHGMTVGLRGASAF
jgi:hypothetical protein